MPKRRWARIVVAVLLAAALIINGMMLLVRIDADEVLSRGPMIAVRFGQLVLAASAIDVAASLYAFCSVAFGTARADGSVGLFLAVIAITQAVTTLYWTVLVDADLVPTVQLVAASAFMLLFVLWTAARRRLSQGRMTSGA